MTQKPTKLELCSVNYYASQIAQDCHAAYWLACCNGSAENHLRQTAWKNLETLAALFGAELVEIEHEADEPDPLDAETVAARNTDYEKGVIDAGRGHLIGGAA